LQKAELLLKTKQNFVSIMTRLYVNLPWIRRTPPS